MLSNNEIKLLLVLVDMTESDGLVVYDRTDVVSAYGEEIGADETNRLLNSLRIEGYIVIKMLRADEICLKVTESGRHYAEEIKAIAEAKKKSRIVSVAKDSVTGKTFVEFDDDTEENTAIESEETEESIGETESAEIAIVPDKKLRKKHYGITSFVCGFLGGIIASVGAILTYVFAFGS